KKVIGYKLIKPGYEQAALKIAITDGSGWNPNFTQYGYGFPYDCEAIDNLKEVGEIDLWFEEVYESEFKVGDWFVDHNGRIAMATKIDSEFIYTTNKYHIYGNTNGSDTSWIRLDSNVRKATPEEIK